MSYLSVDIYNQLQSYALCAHYDGRHSSEDNVKSRVARVSKHIWSHSLSVWCFTSHYGLQRMITQMSLNVRDSVITLYRRRSDINNLGAIEKTINQIIFQKFPRRLTFYDFYSGFDTHNLSSSIINMYVNRNNLFFFFSFQSNVSSDEISCIRFRQ